MGYRGRRIILIISNKPWSGDRILHADKTDDRGPYTVANNNPELRHVTSISLGEDVRKMKGYIPQHVIASTTFC